MSRIGSPLRLVGCSGPPGPHIRYAVDGRARLELDNRGRDED